MDILHEVDNLRIPGRPAPLSDEHRRMLEGTAPGQSAISGPVVEGRGYWTATRRTQLEGLFPDWQRRAPALVVPMYSPDGVTTRVQIRPERPRQNRKSGKPVKYETPGGAGLILDVHPSRHGAVGDASVPLLITEGVKTGDSATSRGRCVLVLSGVDCWQSKGEPLPCWRHVALSGRRVFVCFDADVMTKPEVQGALGRLVAFLEGLGADVRIIYLPHPGGLDDNLAAGVNLAELELAARPFTPEALAAERLSRDGHLERIVTALWADWREMPVRAMRENTARSVDRVLLEEAARSGKALKAGRVRVSMDRRTLSERAQTSVRSAHKAIEYLEGEGRLMRANEGRRAEKAGAFILIPQSRSPSDSAKGNQYGEREVTREEGQEGQEVERSKEDVSKNAAFARTSDRGDYILRYAPPTVPELRWPKLILYWATKKGCRKVVDWHYVARLGKKRGAIIGHVLEAGGSVAVEELMDRFASPRTRPWDFRRRTLGPIVEAGIFAPVEESATLTEGWREALEEKRQADDEIADAERQRERYAEQRKKYRRRHEHPADKTPELPSRERMAEILEERRKDEERRWIEAQREKVGTTAGTFVVDELEGVTGVRWRELRERWIERGGSAEALRQAVSFGPFRFEREPSDDNALYVYPGTTAAPREAPATVASLHRKPEQDEPQNVNPQPPPARTRPYKRANGVYVHPGDCACEWCSEDFESSYAQPMGSAS